MSDVAAPNISAEPTTAYNDITQVFIAINRPDGGVSIMGFVTRGAGSGGVYIKEPTPENIQAEIDRTQGLEGITDWTLLPSKDAIPDNRRFRNAWGMHDGEVRVDPVKGRALQMSRIRTARNKALDQTDKDWIMAFSRGEDVREINRKKEKLRDLPAVVEEKLSHATTQEEIEALWPDELEQET